MDRPSSGVLNKSGSVYEHLRRLVVEGRLRPDRRLSPSDLADHFQVSITPVRDALARLHAEGFIGGEAGRGYFTKPFAVGEQRDLLQLLWMGLIASLEEVSRVAPDRLERALGDLRDDGAAAEQAVEAHSAFITGVVSEARSEILRVLMRNVLERTEYVRRLDAARAPRRAALTEGLRDTARAARSGDFGETVATARRVNQASVAELPGLIDEANARIRALRFP